MPQLQDSRKILKLPIKSIEGSEITLKDGVLAGDADFVWGGSEVSDVERTLRALSKMITDWNLVDKAGKKLPVNIDNLKKLDVIDVTEIINATSFSSISDEDKKKQTLKSSK